MSMQLMQIAFTKLQRKTHKISSNRTIAVFPEIYTQIQKATVGITIPTVARIYDRTNVKMAVETFGTGEHFFHTTEQVF